jgi:hypothetical protein
MSVSISGDTGISKVQDGVITAANLESGSVTTDKIADSNVTTAKIADSNVTTAKIADGNVTVAKISATGTPSSSTYLRGDGSWQTISTTPTTDQVLTATAGASVGAVGTYAFLGETTTTTTAAGATRAGSSLRYAGIRSADTFGGDTCAGSFTGIGNGGTPSGTWRAMGRALNGGYPATLWLRVS